MKFGSLLVMGGAVLLTGCSSTALGKADPTPTPAASTPLPTRTASVAQARPAAHTGNSFADGQTDLKNGNYRAATTAFRAAIKTKQHVAAAYAGLGTAYVRLINYPVAYQAFRNASTLDPRNPAYLYNAAYTALYSQNYHVAITYATRFIHLRPTAPSGYHVRFLAYGSLLEPKKQIGDALTIIRLAPRQPDAYNDLGIAYANSRKYSDSIKAFTEAIKLDPTNLNYYTNRAIAENTANDPNAAIADFEKAKTLTSNKATLVRLNGAIAALKKHSKP